MIEIKERSLNAALEATGLTRSGLPKCWIDESQGDWLKAIVLVKKRNGDKSYMLAERSRGGVIRYTRDFGRVSPFCGLLSIHPYEYTDESIDIEEPQKIEIPEDEDKDETFPAFEDEVDRASIGEAPIISDAVELEEAPSITFAASSDTTVKKRPGRKRKIDRKS